MKYKKLISRALAVLLGAMLVAFGVFGAIAVDGEGEGEGEATFDVQTEEITEPIYIDPEPEPEPEPETDPEPIYTDPEPETEPQPEPETEPETEEQQETKWLEEETQEYINYFDNGNTGTTFLITPTVPKTVSQKTYSTNYAFGVTSWICVGVGIIVILSVLISTKAGGRRNNQRI